MKYWFSICMCSMTFCSIFAQNKDVSIRELPVRAKVFLETYYKHMQIASAKEGIVSWFEQATYRVTLQNGKEVLFDADGNWNELDHKLTPIPQALIPEAILRYIHRAFPKTEVTKVRKTAKRYDVLISNGLDLQFNKKGEFLKINH